MKLKLETVRVLTSSELSAAGGWFKLGNLFKVHTVKVPLTNGPTESFDLGYRGPMRKPWIWDEVQRVWRTKP